VSLLTDSAQLASTLDPRKAEERIARACSTAIPGNDAEFAAKDATSTASATKLTLARKAKA